MMTTGRLNAAPLAGIRVLDASRVLAGPFCAQILSDLGAEVLKVERPGSGDETRDWGPPFHGDLSAYFIALNRNKKSMTLDLQRAAGQEIFRRLVIEHDVVIENFRSESTSKLGLTPQSILAIQPRAVVCSVSGYGRTGPLRDLPGYDFAIQALSGMMSVTGPVGGPPTKFGIAITDVLTALYASTAIVSCLHAREKSGHGYTIDIALMDCAVASQVNLLQAFLLEGKVPERQGNAHLQIVPYQLFATSDDWLVLAIGNDTQWRRFCDAAGLGDLATDPKFKTNSQRVERRSELIPILEKFIKARTTAEWRKLLTHSAIPHAPLCTYAEVTALPQSANRNWIVTVKGPNGKPIELVGSPFHIANTALPDPKMPPALGADTDNVLRQQLGLEESQIQALREQGII